jgi:hypothetical protein
MKDLLKSAIRLSRVAALAGSFQATRTFLQKRLWLWPILAALVLGAIGWWVYHAVERSMKEHLADQLSAIRDADVAALRVWLKMHEENVEQIAAQPEVLKLTEELLAVPIDNDNPTTALLQSPAQAQIRQQLKPTLKMLGYQDYFVVNPAGRVVACKDVAALGQVVSEYRQAFYKKVLHCGSTVSVPYQSSLRLPDEQGNRKSGLPTMLAAGRITDEKGKHIAVLALRLRPEAEFTDILTVARFGKTGETYAFDRNGLMLTQSRFDKELKRIGLLADLPDSRSVLTLQMRNPGVNMAEGQRPDLDRSDQPLTRPAAEATGSTHTTGVDVDGYGDYRGVPNVGAWTWLDDYDFGVVTEVDAWEALRPLTILRGTFWGLFALLSLSALVIFIFMLVVARQQRQVREAVLAARQLGQYHLEEKLGAGGMGTVYRAKHAMLRRPTAVKLLNVGQISEAAIARFEREVQMTSQLEHPNTITIYDYGKTPEGIFYYAMEYLEGMNLEDLVIRNGPLPDGRALAILRQLCGSLAEAHALGVIHRDVKPANVILTRRGGLFDFVKVLDFGLVKAIGAGREAGLTSSGSLTGTPMYLAPESIEKPETVDAHADVYAVGAVGCYLLTGLPLFDGSSVYEICMHHVRTPPVPPSQRVKHPVSPSLEALLMRCLAKKPDERPADARAVLDELARCEPVVPWTQADAKLWWEQLDQQRSSSAISAPRTVVVNQTLAYVPEAASQPDVPGSKG